MEFFLFQFTEFIAGLLQTKGSEPRKLTTATMMVTKYIVAKYIVRNIKQTTIDFNKYSLHLQEKLHYPIPIKLEITFC